MGEVPLPLLFKMLTSEIFKDKGMGDLIKIKILNNVFGDGKTLKAGEIVELPPRVATSLINYGDAEISEGKTQAKPKTKKTAKKKTAKSEPIIDAQR